MVVQHVLMACLCEEMAAIPEQNLMSFGASNVASSAVLIYFSLIKDKPTHG